MIDRAMGIPRMIDTWVPLVGAERFHVVTVPYRSDDPDLLWKRFAGVVGINPSRCRERAVESNASLGLPSSELMRLLNLELGPVTRTEYLRTMKSLLARDILGERADQERKVTLNRPGRNLSARWNDRVRQAIETSGVQLVGSIDDLPVTKAGKDVPSELESPTDEELLFAAAWARKGMIDAIAELEARIARLREERADNDAGRRVATIRRTSPTTDGGRRRTRRTTGRTTTRRTPVSIAPPCSSASSATGPRRSGSR